MLTDRTIIRPQKPTLFSRVGQKIRAMISRNGRLRLNEKYRREIKEKDFSLIASFCGGGTLYHDIGLQFLSPTINLAFDGEDFCKFCMDIPYYLSRELTEIKTDQVSYPVGRLDDVEIRFVHYHSFDEAKRKWDERSKRVNLDKILVLATDRDGMINCMERFDGIPYRKIMYTAKQYPQYDWTVYCPSFANEPCVGIMTGIADLQGHRYYEKNVDILAILQTL